MRSPDAEVAVVGLGAFGAASLWQLAEAGVSVIGLDRYEPGHGYGSSHGGTRMFRTACLEHPGLVPLARRSGQLWQELSARAGETLFAPTGGVLIGPRDGHVVAGTLAAARQHDIAVEVWDAATLGARLPRHAGLAAHHVAVWEPAAGLIPPEAAIRAAVRVAGELGAQVRTGTRVSAIELVDGGAFVHTTTDRIAVRQVVVAAGAWLPGLVPGLTVRVLRVPITWFRPADPSASGYDLAAVPVFIRELDDGACLWGHGAHTDGELKLGLEDVGTAMRTMDPDGDDRRVTPADWRELADRLAVALPGLAPEPSRAAVCMYPLTPDRQFLLGRPGHDPRLVVAGGDSGHGFKHATAIGEVVADLVRRRAPRVPVAFMHPDRW
ncbi:N-methyl-L-tryptophan oxidase [Micromonospora sp. WMMD980]|uniref:N-methyl-L-tryptophan oxidase n=1 Tax=Micromonospora sp. WMMD980 TaxID=3016088 RepID=UPI0024171DD5|nr:N-methyl-L-tryptophan oxidase [Micromonospora sp. WMMD980]MDG4799977.1 N-methyl-L-tryptophan oxidase [Micromonospora sp. WMMD980]